MRRSVGALACAMLAVLLTVATSAPRAHKAITSKFTYNEHVFPIVRDRCGRCHVEGGPAPMSLMTHRDAQPWAESIREQLLSEAMPPWYADPLAPGMKGGHTLNARDLDVLLTWAVGGAPEGDPSKAPASIDARAGWRAGAPDAILTMPSPHVVASGVLRSEAEAVIPTGFGTERWVTAIDLLPGAPSMVRAATIATEGGRVLAAWVPGDDVVRAPSGTAFRLAPGETLRLRVQYAKNWQDELVEKSDRSSIGLYFGDAPVTGRGIESLATPQQTVSTPVRVLSVTPLLDRDYESVSVEAVLPAGKRTLLLKLRAPRASWSRRYWLMEPIELPRNSRIEVTTEGAPGSPRIALDFVPL